VTPPIVVTPPIINPPVIPPIITEPPLSPPPFKVTPEVSPPQTITAPPGVKTVEPIARSFGIKLPPPQLVLGKGDEAADEGTKDAPANTQTDVSWPVPASIRWGR
jgi:hypothetical protein